MHIFSKQFVKPQTIKHDHVHDQVDQSVWSVAIAPVLSRPSSPWPRSALSEV